MVFSTAAERTHGGRAGCDGVFAKFDHHLVEKRVGPDHRLTQEFRFERHLIAISPETHLTAEDHADTLQVT